MNAIHNGLLKVGTIVTTKTREKLEKEFCLVVDDDCWWPDPGMNTEMIKYFGRKATITEKNNKWYHLDIDYGSFSWSDWMIEKTNQQLEFDFNEET